MRRDIKALVKLKRLHPPMTREINTVIVETLRGRLKKVYACTQMEIDSGTISRKLNITIWDASILLKSLHDMGVLKRKQVQASYGIKFVYWRAE